MLLNSLVLPNGIWQMQLFQINQSEDSRKITIMYDNPSGQLHQRSITSAFNYIRTYSISFYIHHCQTLESLKRISTILIFLWHSNYVLLRFTIFLTDIKRLATIMMLTSSRVRVCTMTQYMDGKGILQMDQQLQVFKVNPYISSYSKFRNFFFQKLYRVYHSTGLK